MPAERDTGHEDKRSHDEAIARLLSDVRAAWAAGRSVNEGAILASHPELMPELGEQLRRLREQGAGRGVQPLGETIARPIPRGSQNESARQGEAPGSDFATGSFGGGGLARGPASIQVPGHSIQREISRGGQAVVYLAIQLSTGRKVAVKVMREGPLADERQMARFQREVQILAALDHPNIVSIIDTGRTADGSLFISMPFIAGMSLDEYMQQRQQKDGGDPSRMLRLFYKVCLAIHEAHVREIVHRDLKPSNIRVDERGEPHILDFGLARSGLDKYMAGTQEPVSVTGEFLGSLPWASPEQADGDPEKIDRRTDVYSLGVILYQVLTGGRFPYEVVGNIRDVLNNIASSEPKPPSQVIAAMAAAQAQGKRATLHKLPAVNEIMEQIVLKALAKRKEARYQSADELGKDIARYLRGTMVQPSPANGDASRQAAGVAGGKPPARRGRAAAVIAAGAIALLLAATGIAWRYFGKTQDSKVEPVAATKANATKEVPAALTKINNGKDESVALTKRGSKDAGTEQARPAAISKANSPNSVRESQSEQWISLFNGKDLTGWQVPTPLMRPPGMTDDSTRWTVQNGVIEGRGTARRGNGRGGGESIQTTQLFHDFHLRFNTMLVQGQNGSVRFAIPAGVELADRARSGRLVSVKIFIVGNDTVQKTGNIMVDGLTKQIAKSDTPPAGTYFSMDIVHNHDTVSVLVNDRPVASYSDPRLDGQGYIMLDASGDAVVRFKDVRIMALKDAGALAQSSTANLQPDAISPQNAQSRAGGDADRQPGTDNTHAQSVPVKETGTGGPAFKILFKGTTFEMLVNSKSVKQMNRADSTQEVETIPVTLNSGDEIKLRVSSRFVWRHLRFEYTDAKGKVRFSSDPENLLIAPAGGSAPEKAELGMPGPDEHAWEDAKLSADAKWIKIPREDAVYEITFKVP